MPGFRLVISQSSYQFAAEGRDVWDHAAPDQVKMSCGRPEPISEGLLGRQRNTYSSWLVCSWVWR
jgi:hypothetical protein